MTTTTPHSQRLVCGVDSSEHAHKVLAVGARLARGLGLQLQLVHSARPDAVLTGLRAQPPAWGQQTLDFLDPSHQSDDRVVELTPPTALLRHALEGAALGVIGSRGRGWIRRTVFGSVSQQLTHRAPCPVVVVPTQATADMAERPAVVCGVDGSAHAARALDVAATMASALESQLVVVHVRGYPTRLGGRPSLNPLKDHADGMAIVESAVADVHADLSQLAVSMRVVPGEPAMALSAVAEQEATGAILVVGSQGHGRIHNALTGSVSRWLANHASTPVVVVPPSAGPLVLARSRQRWWAEQAAV